jgi:hypothetical protein
MKLYTGSIVVYTLIKGAIIYVHIILFLMIIYIIIFLIL